MLKGMGIDGTALIATSEHSPMVHKSARNISGISVLPVSDLNALAVLKPRKVLFTKAALDLLKQGPPATKEVAAKSGGQE